MLDRLVFRKHYGLAIQIAQHLKLSEYNILEHWAIYKVKNDKNDEDVARKISQKFKNPSIRDISFCNIANVAQAIGRKKLAIMVLYFKFKSNHIFYEFFFFYSCWNMSQNQVYKYRYF